MPEFHDAQSTSGRRRSRVLPPAAGAGGNERAAHYVTKLAALAAAQKAGALGADFAPRELLYAVIALAGWWHATPQLAQMIMTEGVETARDTLVRMVAKLIS